MLQGNVVDLAVGIILGIAFGTVVDSIVSDVLLSFIAAIFGEPSYDSLSFNAGGGVIAYGRTMTALMNFPIIAVRFAINPRAGLARV